jgi:hypothetical protein
VVDGWPLGRWVDVKVVLWIAYSNQQTGNHDSCGKKMFFLSPELLNAFKSEILFLEA